MYLHNSLIAPDASGERNQTMTSLTSRIKPIVFTTEWYLLIRLKCVWAVRNKVKPLSFFFSFPLSLFLLAPIYDQKSLTCN